MRPSHRLVRAVLLVASLSLTGAAAAARLGPITVVSTAGQPLRAEIDLEDGTAAAWSRSQVRLGSPDTYRDLGLEYPAALEGATAVLARSPDGRYRVVVTGSRPIADPRAVPLVVTLRTPSGLHTRSYRAGDDGRADTQAATAGTASGPVTAAPMPTPVTPLPALADPGSAVEPATSAGAIRMPTAPVSTGLTGPGEADRAAGTVAAPGTDEAARAAALAARMDRVAASVEPAPPVADTLRLPWPSETVRLPQVAEASAATVEPAARTAPPPVAGASPPSQRGATADRAGRPAPAGPAAGPLGAPEADRSAGARTVSVVPGDTATAIARRIKPDGVADEQAVMALYRSNEQAFLGSVHRLPAGAVLVIPDADQIRALPLARARAELNAQPAPPRRVAVATGPSGDRLTLSAGGSGRGTAPDASGGAGERERIAHEAAMAEAKSRIDQLESIVSDLKRLIGLREQQIAALTREVAEAGGAGASGASQDGRLVPVGAAAATMIRSESRAAAPMPIAPPPEQASPSLLWSGLVGGLAIAAGGAFWFVRRRRR